MVGTHIPDDRDEFRSALQRIRAAFDGLCGGDLDAGAAQDEFLAGYDVIEEMSTAWFLGPDRGRT